MSNFKKQREIYESIEIPSELESVIEDAIAKASPYSKVRRSVFVKLVPAVALVVLLTIAGNERMLRHGGPDYGKFHEGETEVTEESEMFTERMSSEFNLKRELPKQSNVQATRALGGAPAEECDALLDEASGEITEIYSDDKIMSYSITEFPSGEISFYNVWKNDGTEVKIESLIGDDSVYNSDNCQFYVTSGNTLVVIKDGVEKEIIYN